MSHKPHIILTVSVLVLWVSVVVGAVLLGPLADFPAFEMTREVTYSDGATHSYRAVYEEDGSWKQWHLSDAGEVKGISSYGRGGIPGPWWGNARVFIWRHKGTRGGLVTRERVGPDEVVTVVYGFERTEARYHAATGIPVSYERSVAGTVVERHVVTSLMVGGEKVR